MANRILHVSCAFGGGIVTSVTAMARNFPEAEHHLLAYTPVGAHIPITEPNPFASVTPILKMHHTIRSLWDADRQIRPDVIHLHSSLAGGFGRISFLPSAKLIYTPHCFVFEHTAMSAWKRNIYFILENLCSLGGAKIAGVSPREVALAQKMIGHPSVHYLPNYADVPDDIRSTPLRTDPESRTAVMIGRLLPQKDPSFFLDLQRELRALDTPFKLKWIGGGEPDEVAKLEGAGIEVTGWIDHHSVLRHLADADLYLHTAAWEGMPMSLLEAAHLDRPILVRDIPALRNVGLEPLYETPSALAKAIATNASLDNLIELQKVSKSFSARFSRSAQHEALKTLYLSSNATEESGKIYPRVQQH